MHHQITKNKRGFMHPISDIGKQFVFFSQSHSPVIDMGCAYGNVSIDALNAGTKKIFACDLEQKHLDILKQKIDPLSFDRLETVQGYFPQDFEFAENSISAIHASHLLEYLNGREVTEGLQKFYRWLKPGGKLFILCYTIFIKELDNEIFKCEYSRRKTVNTPWPGYLENYDSFIASSTEETAIEDNPFPTALHLYERSVLAEALMTLGFALEFAEYIDGKNNGAVEETWLDGREYLGIIAVKNQ